VTKRRIEKVNDESKPGRMLFVPSPKEYRSA
jgi:hypothetical protein